VNEAEKWKWEVEPVYRDEIQYNHVHPDSSDESENEAAEDEQVNDVISDSAVNDE
ncbi:hypothetical protein A2U01_0117786, partial [Trifolium medium]|nr:hypothetical protein [Trifolium medium]